MRKEDYDKNRFQNRFTNLGINKDEMDRMYRQHLWEQAEMERLQAIAIMEAQQRGAQQVQYSSGGSAITQEEPTPIPTGYVLTMGVDAINTNSFYVGINSTPDGPMNLIFNWGDGTVETFVHDPSTQINYDHAYAAVGTYTMTLEIDEPDYVAGIIIDAND